MNFFRLLKQAAQLWSHKGADQYAAALAYFVPFALAPLLLISITLVGLIIGRADVVTLLLRWGGYIDPALPQFMATSINNFESLTTSYTVPMFALLIFSAMILFALNSLSGGLQYLWDVERYGWRNIVRRSFRSGLFVLLFQVYLVATIITNNIFATASIASGLAFLNILASAIFFISTTFLMAIGFGLLPLSAPSFTARLYGAAVATVLFLFSRTVVALQISTSPSPDIYGAAGLVFVLLIWLYVSACIIYYGAAFAYVYDVKDINKITNQPE